MSNFILILVWSRTQGYFLAGHFTCIAADRAQNSWALGIGLRLSSGFAKFGSQPVGGLLNFALRLLGF